jgi:hypothetical protein
MMRASDRAGFLGLGTCLVVSLLAAGGSEARAATFTDLTLQNGWVNAPFGTRNAGASLVDGIVYFTGAIADGTSAVAFTLPSELRPATSVYVPVSLCGAPNGRLVIQPSGVVSIQAEHDFGDAQCLTSLEGVSFAPSAVGFTALSLISGWTNAPFGTSSAMARVVNGIVHLKGAIANGTSQNTFVLPPGFRPDRMAYVAVDLCGATIGRLDIFPDGNVKVDVENGVGDVFGPAQCFTSLDGATFATTTSSVTPLTLLNGWGANSGGPPGVELVGGMVHFTGGLQSNAVNPNPVPFVLPSGFRPEANVYVPVDMCYLGKSKITKGALLIDPSGVVTVQAEIGPGSTSDCVTLDSAAFPVANFRPLTLQNGWTSAPFATTTAAVAITEGVVRLRGAIATGAVDPLAFTLPVGFRPTATVHVPTDLCGAAKGRLVIQPSGTVTVEAGGGVWFNAQCFTSLEGISFVAPAATVIPLNLQNGWTGAPAGTRSAAATLISGIVRLEGAVATAGANLALFTLPPQLRPATSVFVPVDLCNAAIGRLGFDPGGAVTVRELGDGFTSAPCTTSLEGVAFPLSTAAFAPLTLVNGWTHAPFSTRNASVRNISGIVTFGGAIQSAGTNPVPFTLPPELRPATNVFVPVGLCGANKGRLWIQPSGTVTVQEPGGTVANATCFTSLEGASFAL